MSGHFIGRTEPCTRVGRVMANGVMWLRAGHSLRVLPIGLPSTSIHFPAEYRSRAVGGSTGAVEQMFLYHYRHPQHGLSTPVHS